MDIVNKIVNIAINSVIAVQAAQIASAVNSRRIWVRDLFQTRDTNGGFATSFEVM